MTLHRPIRAASAVMLAAVLFAACGSDDSGGDAPGGAGNDGDAGGVLNVGSDIGLIGIDPHQSSAEESVLTVSYHVFDTLVRRDGEDFVPHLAESWETPDDTTWVFTLRDDATFHDGTPVTAQHFKASLERLLSLEAAQAPLWVTLDEVEATDDHTVTIKTIEPMGTMLSSLSLLFILPVEEYDLHTERDAEPNSDYFRAPIGSGAFRVEEFVPDERTVLVRNDDYWGDPPLVEQIIFREIPEMSTRMTALETGEIDLALGIPEDQVEVMSSNSNLVYESTPSWFYSFIWYNHTREPLDDVRVRRALWHALDIESTVADLLSESASVSQAPIPQSVFGASVQTPYEYNPELAQQLLAEAGYPDGLELEMQYADGNFSNIRDVAATFVSYWADIGVTVTPLEKQRAEWLSDLSEKNYDLNMQGNQVTSGDADFTLARLYMCEPFRMGYCSEELDSVLLAARTALDQTERERLYDEAARIIWDDAVGIFPMEFVKNAAWHTYVEGFTPSPAMADFHTVTVQR
jgi:peptide/nickel transport system substrate-binding protein